MNDLDKAVERLESVDQPYDRRLTYRRVREDDLRLVLSVLHQRGEALATCNPGNAMLGRILAACAHYSNLPCDAEARADRLATFRAARQMAQALSNTTGSRGVE